MSASADINGLLRGLGQAREAGLRAARQAIGEFAMMVVSKSQYYAPKDTGALAASGTWGEVVLSGDAYAVEVGHNTEYAAAVHEVLTAKHAPPTRAKYLETAIREYQPKFGQFVADRVKVALGN